MTETTRTIITPGNDGAVYEDNTPKLTDKEKKVAKHMFKDSKILMPNMRNGKMSNLKGNA